MSRLLLTGATGFVGSTLLSQLEDHHEVRVLLRSEKLIHGKTVLGRITGAHLEHPIDLGPALEGIEIVVHAAARAHVLKDNALGALDLYRATNTIGTLALAREAAARGVRRFVFISSVKAQGESSVPGHPLSEDQPCEPIDPYGISKREAEVGLLELAAETGMEVTIVRPPLVYGPGVKANFLRLVRTVQRGIPTPFGSIQNHRSLVSIGNLAAFVLLCCEHPAAKNQIFYVSDGCDRSTPELVRLIARAFDRPPLLLPIPTSWLAAGFWLIGKGPEGKRLLGSLQVSTEKAKNILGWTPTHSIESELRRMVMP